MSILLVTPEYAPQRGGVADYSRQLAAHLARTGAAVGILASAGARGEPQDAFTVRGEISDWHWRGGLRLARACRDLRPEVVLLQYVPYLYQRRGLPFHLVSVAAHIRSRAATPVVLVCHELFVFAGPVRHRALGLLQRILLRVLDRQVDALVVTTGRRLEFLASRGFPRSRLHLIRVGSSLPEEVAAPALGAAAFRVVVFGNLDVERRRLDLVCDAVERLGARSHDSTIELELIGATPASCAALLSSRPAAGPGFRIRATGPLPASEAATRLAGADAGVHFDTTGLGGISSRSTACAALLAAGLPVVGNQGADTDEIYRDGDAVLFCHLDADDLAEKLSRLRASLRLRHELGVAARRLYDRELSWARISSGYLALLQDLIRQRDTGSLRP